MTKLVCLIYNIDKSWTQISKRIKRWCQNRFKSQFWSMSILMLIFWIHVVKVELNLSHPNYFIWGIMWGNQKMQNKSHTRLSNTLREADIQKQLYTRMSIHTDTPHTLCRLHSREPTVSVLRDRGRMGCAWRQKPCVHTEPYHVSLFILHWIPHVCLVKLIKLYDVCKDPLTYHC